MYFWRIEELKTAMAARPLSDREVAPYLVVAAGLSSVLWWTPETELNFWDGADTVLSIAVAVLGTLHVYERNGGAQGQHLLQRYFAIGWVVGIRFLAVVLPLLFGYYFLLFAAFGVETQQTTWQEFLMFAALQISLYWRFGHHVRDLAQRSGTAPRPGADNAAGSAAASGAAPG
ncbi:MAG: hypothetical protein GC161_12040 [Planctomycetaceae bacterium]|nr:hypothetical protein [Planctomycetaceae bacterium]